MQNTVKFLLSISLFLLLLNESCHKNEQPSYQKETINPPKDMVSFIHENKPNTEYEDSVKKCVEYILRYGTENEKNYIENLCLKERKFTAFIVEQYSKLKIKFKDNSALYDLYIDEFVDNSMINPDLKITLESLLIPLEQKRKFRITRITNKVNELRKTLSSIEDKKLNFEQQNYEILRQGDELNKERSHLYFENMTENCTTISGYVVSVHARFPNKIIYEVVILNENSRALLTTTETEFSNKGYFELLVKSTGKVSMILKEEYGGFTQYWPTYLEITRNERQKISSKKSALVKIEDSIESINKVYGPLKSTLVNYIIEIDNLKELIRSETTKLRENKAALLSDILNVENTELAFENPPSKDKLITYLKRLNSSTDIILSQKTFFLGKENYLVVTQDEAEDCHVCAPNIRAYLFLKNGNNWFLESKSSLGEIGSWGKSYPLKIIKLGQKSFGLQFNWTYGGQGYEYSGIAVRPFYEGDFGQGVSIGTAEGEMGEIPDKTWEVKFTEGDNPDYFDIKVISLDNEIEIYKFREGKYLKITSDEK